MEELDGITLAPDATITEPMFYSLIDAVRRQDTVYKEAGAVHGCALAERSESGARILMFIEDVGRHNAVDAIAGRMWLERVGGADKIFYTTGRLTSEMVIKCAQMGIPILVSRSGLTQMGYEVATAVGMTMIGRATGKHYLLFTGKERFRK
jgi:FdhD protein